MKLPLPYLSVCINPKRGLHVEPHLFISNDFIEVNFPKEIDTFKDNPTDKIF